MEIRNLPSANPKTGRITAQSVIAALRKLTGPLRVAPTAPPEAPGPRGRVASSRGAQWRAGGRRRHRPRRPVARAVQHQPMRVERQTWPRPETRWRAG
ncbi:hypothetical protein G6F57_021182 [Rhizopus arrhizus]|nr:hypothetical protein G6F57_021182 [Rhizopus arrhizus]